MKRKKFAAACLAAMMLAPTAHAETLYGGNETQSPQPEWLKDAVIYEVNLRQGTSDRNLKGMQLQLPRLKDLGVDVLWLMPIHPISEKNRKGSLGSYYAVQDYMKVNPEFGTMADLKEFVRTAHSLGMKVIIDEVCNHSGCDNGWLTTNPDFYARDSKGALISPFDWTDTYKFDYSNPAMRRAMIDALKFWVSEADIDGFRFDVAGEVPTDFWEQARPEVQAIKPVLFLAEASKPELLVKAFDADYAWPMKDVFGAIAATQGVNGYAAAKGQKLPKQSAQDIVKLLEKQSKEYPRGAVNMQMITNHDLNSWEGTEFERFGPATGAFAILSYTLPGMPMIYTGQEVGFNHPFEFFELDSVQPDYKANEFTAMYQMLNKLKHSHPALHAGKDGGLFTPIATSSPDVLAFERSKNGDRVFVVANLSSKEQNVKFKQTPDLKGMTNYFTSAEAMLPEKLAPWEYAVYTVPSGK